MAAVRSKNTKPEMVLRRALHRMGFRYSLHRRDLPGKPDLVFASRRTVVFVNGCFWHGHSCPAGALPKTRRDFWEAKIKTNRCRDQRNLDELNAKGWRAITVWECALRDPDTPLRLGDELDGKREETAGCPQLEFGTHEH